MVKICVKKRMVDLIYDLIKTFNAKLAFEHYVDLFVQDDPETDKIFERFYVPTNEIN